MKLVYTAVLSGATALDEGYSDVFCPMKQTNMGKKRLFTALEFVLF